MGAGIFVTRRRWITRRDSIQPGICSANRSGLHQLKCQGSGTAQRVSKLETFRVVRMSLVLRSRQTCCTVGSAVGLLAGAGTLQPPSTNPPKDSDCGWELFPRANHDLKLDRLRK
jgi:hypothetical protein